jgi:hypothetical protein
VRYGDAEQALAQLGRCEKNSIALRPMRSGGSTGVRRLG